MTSFRADLDALTALVSAIERFDSGAGQAVADLDRRVDRLHAVWTGAAAEAHLAAHQRWLRSHAEVRAAAEAVRALVSTAHHNYASAVAVNERMWT